MKEENRGNMLTARRNKLLLSIISVILSVSLAATAIFAWFVSIKEIKNTVIIYTGDIDLAYDFYIGYDEEKDGSLDPIPPLLPEDVPTSLSRAQMLSTYYRQIPREYDFSGDEANAMLNWHEGCISGTSLSYKMMFINAADNATDAEVLLSLSNLEEYFYTSLTKYRGSGSIRESDGSLSQELYELLGKNASRIMFKIEGITARRYVPNRTGEGEEEPSSFTTGYSKLVASSNEDEITTGVGTISLSSTESYLWDISNGQYFVDGVRVNRGELLEIDFKLSCMQMDEIVNNYDKNTDYYIAQARAYIINVINWGPPNMALARATSYTGEMMKVELQYIFGEDEITSGQEKKLDFSIKHFVVTGMSLPE